MFGATKPVLPRLWNFRVPRWTPGRLFQGGIVAQPTNKVEVYRLLYRLNRGFAFIVKHLMELEPMRMIPPKDMKMFQARVTGGN